jgi:hypothetical protein
MAAAVGVALVVTRDDEDGRSKQLEGAVSFSSFGRRSIIVSAHDGINHHHQQLE